MPAVKSKPFRIQKLPDKVLQSVVGLMDIGTRLSLVVTSAKTENMMLQLEYPKEFIHNILFDEQPILYKADISVLPHCHSPDSVKFNCGRNKKKKQPLPSAYYNLIAKWSGRNTSCIDRMQNVYRKINILLPSHVMNLFLGKLKTVDAQKIMAAEEFSDWYRVRSLPGIKPETIRCVLDKADLNKQFCFDEEEQLPLDFAHPKAFQFEHSSFHDARWVKMPQLLTIKDVYEVRLGHSNFYCKDIGVLLCRMLESQHHMCKFFSVTYAGPFQLADVIQGVVTVKRRSNPLMFLVSPRTKNAAKIGYLTVHLEDSSLTIAVTNDRDQETETRKYMELFKKEIDLNAALKNMSISDSKMKKMRKFEKMLDAEKKEAAQAMLRYWNTPRE
ncbi:hypothetical protein CRE_28834 [Caenorhabditis remanei]|uniref:F-box domain-containing protein n=1 Tax=Caenorhabditis remanei TaxID=31234 RepID=E3MXK1_CAERE|nr:hypothetical protein CRE_28834 [Caenorhabditis remanei]